MLGGIGGRRRRGQQRMRWLDGITDSIGHEFEWTLGVGDGQGGLACCDSRGRNESDTTERLNGTELMETVACGAFLRAGLEKQIVHLWLLFIIQPCKWNQWGQQNFQGGQSFSNFIGKDFKSFLWGIVLSPSQFQIMRKSRLREKLFDGPNGKETLTHNGRTCHCLPWTFSFVPFCLQLYEAGSGCSLHCPEETEAVKVHIQVTFLSKLSTSWMFFSWHRHCLSLHFAKFKNVTLIYINRPVKSHISRTSLVVQWLRLCTASTRGMGSVPGGGTKIPHAMWHGPKNKAKLLKLKHRKSWKQEKILLKKLNISN